ncbi:DUF3859 domain-containing protein [Vibrio neptunius]|uniref:DUF3859 domain-containing protein n=1 Tax=Vibrio neptunius TaxID=170651 RepID=A0ABS3A6W7_9VIBR|nr:DUF3859 domain-containing protein [Vibrio neptunius]MBN3495371.1 DUF3859 domain-containing protein [Vibrio neptunius]MBN3517909.1 DUF3859 domain-containing protein [Vibrio neptunius]MBN3552250.1 DUF3859 domain-containing protein [Vibrio neptunius]MBN3580217.1 DUF3859 domain-containing protein [Vibrio neptunius]MCH9873883.1 DUF3859 domain-containing protein [Vibrio neptunius]
MKPLISLLTLLLTLSGCNSTPKPVLINEIKFKDSAFERCIKKLDVEEVAQVTHIICNYGDIQDVSELGYFTQAQDVQFVENNIERIDLSSLPQLKRLTVSGNGLTTIDVSSNPQLEFINISRNALTELDLSNNPKLTGLYAYQTQLEELELGHLTELKRLGVSQSQLTELDLSQSYKLEELIVTGANLKELDVSHLTRLRHLELPNNQLKQIILKTHPQLVMLNVRNNQLQDINLSGVSRVNRVMASFNQLSAINLSALPLLHDAELNNNNISQLDVQYNKQLTRLLAFNNPLVSFTRDDDQEIKYLSIEGTPVAKAHFEDDALGAVIPTVTVLKGGKKPSIKDNFRPLYSQIIAPELGDFIGFQYKVTTNSNHGRSETFPITVRVTHPPIKSAGNQKTFTVSSWPDTMFEHDRNQALWQFSSPEELVAGVWTFEIIYQQRVLAEHNFVVQTDDESVFVDAAQREEPFKLFDSVIDGTNMLCHDERFYQCLNIESAQACHKTLVPFESDCKAKALKQTHQVFQYRVGNTLEQLKRYDTFYLACLAEGKLEQVDGDMEQFADCLLAD